MGLIGNPVKIGSGPAAVIEDVFRIVHCRRKSMGRSEITDDPRARIPALLDMPVIRVRRNIDW